MISIHAPTRGATKVHPDKRQVRSISIHAPTRGATSSSLCCCTYSRISIHAPTRGATTIITRSLLILVFQSTLPQGERLQRTLILNLSHYFNPRSHKGSDQIQELGSDGLHISIHAPTRGATLTVMCI